MGTTTLGYTYPDDTDDMDALPDTIQDLAQEVDDNIGLVKNGTVSVAVAATNTDVQQAVVFGTAFPAGHVPNVVATISNKPGPSLYSPVTITAKSETGFTLNVRRSGGTTPVQVDWIAVAT